MATRASAATPAIEIEGHASSRRLGQHVGTWSLTLPAIALLLVFFLLPRLLHRQVQPRVLVLRSDRGRRRDRRRVHELHDASLVGLPRPGHRPRGARVRDRAHADLGRRDRVRRARRRRSRRKAHLGPLRRLDRRDLLRASDRALPDHPGGQQPAARRRAVLERRLPEAVLQVDHDGDHLVRLGGADRIPDRLLPRVRDQEVEVHLAAHHHHAVPDELPAADLCLEDHPRRPGTDQQRALLRWGAIPTIPSRS